MTSAVMVQITTVSMKGSSSETKPSVMGSLVRTAECAIAAEPTPASLEKAARLNPWINAPTMPPATPSPVKGAGKNLAEGPTDLVRIQSQNYDGSADIHDAHEGNHLFGYLGDRLQATDDDRENDNGKYQARDPARITTDNPGDLLVRLVGLEHIAATERAENTEHREHDRQKPCHSWQAAFCKALGQVVHRATRHGTVFVFVTILDAERTFGELRGHAHQTRLCGV